VLRLSMVVATADLLMKVDRQVSGVEIRCRLKTSGGARVDLRRIDAALGGRKW
jgi:hypothetical protein